MSTPALSTDASAKEKSDRVELNIWGIKIELPVPRPVLYGAAVVLLLGGLSVFFSKYLVVVQREAWSNASKDAAAYAQLLPNTELAEFPKHWNETPKWTFPSTTGSPAIPHPGPVPPGIKLDYYESDGCILVTRESPGKPKTQHWVLDLSRVSMPAPPPAQNTGAKSSVPITRSAAETLLAELEVPPPPGHVTSGEGGRRDDRSLAELLEADHNLQLKPVQMAGGHCINPHPGRYNQWYGQVNGCFVQVWRQWPDGCTHFQWFNRCLNYFDPAINWSRCVH
jgi:hypothetical protein